MLEREQALLIVTDVQGNLAQAMFQRDVLFRNLGIIIEGSKLLGIPIFWLEQYPEGLGPTVPEVACHLEGLTPLPKKAFSALREPDILGRFRAEGRKQALLTGIETHVCIYQTAMDMLSMGIEPHVVSDAVSSRTLDNKALGLEKIARAGGHITSVETALFEMLGTAGGATFKKILKLVK